MDEKMLAGEENFLTPWVIILCSQFMENPIGKKKD